MNISHRQTETLVLTDIDRLDPVTVFVEDIESGQGKLTITCYGEAWTALWAGMGDKGVCEFVLSCDEHYIANKLGAPDSEILDIEAMKARAEKKGIEVWRDDPWNDYEFMGEMYGSDMSEWSHSIPMRPNPKYQYLCRIIRDVQAGIKQHMANGNGATA